ncbi:MAG: 2-oxoglutarate dehydrogenase complex dihydrolipoyllysine-residue succinyltransferase [Kiloniellales bacterium]
MATLIVVPALGESVAEATVAKWLKAVGDTVEADDPLVEIETDKVTLEVGAPAAGTLTEILADEGAEVVAGAKLGTIAEGAAAAAPAKAEAKTEPARAEAKAETTAEAVAPAPAEAQQPAAAAPAILVAPRLSPAVRKLVSDNKLDPALIPASGKNGRLTKGDVLAYLERRAEKPAPRPAAPVAPPAPPTPPAELPPRPEDPREERVPMSRLRRRVAERLKEAQNTAAMLTTFNEIDMSALSALRVQYREAFEKKYGVRMGFMSAFVKAAIVALKELPAVNAEIYGDDIVYKNYYDIGIAVGSAQGLVVPVLRDADNLSFAEIETEIVDFARRARDGKLTIAELTGGTFTITNGGVYGSLLSTPILNPPQSGILGMHKIEPRPVAVDGKVEVRPMMYVALSYDHRIIDGREAVSFLVRVKECIEDPQRILLDI